MRILIAEDDLVTAHILQKLLRSWEYNTVTVKDGLAAMETLRAEDPPELALLDWMMPGKDGPDVCRVLRAEQATTYIILLTSRTDRADVVAGLDAGADDYLIKPFDPQELRARLKAGIRIIDLQQSLAAHVAELQDALANVRRLNGLLPICSYCKAIRDDSDYWHRVEEYVTEHADVKFSHGICPKCLEKVLDEVDNY
jgi:sigma-B regulation protein RsbU (phosphoserine phosphatase)